MRVDAVLNLRQTAEYWDYVTTQTDSGETNVTFFKSRDIKLMVIDGGDRPVAFTRESMRNNAKLHNVLDAAGNPVFAIDGEPYDVFLGTPIPVMDVFGHVMGYRYGLMRSYTTE